MLRTEVDFFSFETTSKYHDQSKFLIAYLLNKRYYDMCEWNCEMDRQADNYLLQKSWNF